MAGRRRASKYMIVKWPDGWALYRVLKKKHGNPPANDLTELATEAQGNLKVQHSK